MVGTSTRTVDYAKRAEEAFEDLQRAFSRIGRITESSPATLSLTGTTRYGLQRVKLRVSAHRRDSTSCTIEIGGAGDDIWGGAARKASDKLVRVLGSQPGSQAG